MMKNSHLALTVASFVFAVVALAHLLRIIYHLDVVIGGQTISMNVSYAGFLVTLVLSVWMFKAR